MNTNISSTKKVEPYTYNSKILPNFSFDSQFNVDEINNLRKIRILSNNDTQKKSVEIKYMHPEIFAQKYDWWLNQLCAYFQEAHLLNSVFEDISLNTLCDYCFSLNDLFKSNYWIPLTVKKRVDGWANQIITKGWFTEEEKLLVYTSKIPSAHLFLEVHSEYARTGNNQSIQYLQNTFFLHNGYTQEHINKSNPNRAVPKIINNSKELYDQKIYLEIERKTIRVIDDIITKDNFEELILWKLGNHRLPLIALYKNINNIIRKYDQTYEINPQQIDVDALLHGLKKLHTN